MIVSMWMTRDVVTVDSTASIGTALRLLTARRIRRLVIVEGEGTGRRLAGIVTATDINRACPPHLNPYSAVAPDVQGVSTTVGEIMSSNVATTGPDAPIENAAAQMRDRKISALPVMRGGEVVGIITESDIFRAFISMLDSPVRGARVTFDASNDEDVFALVAECAQRHGVRVLSLVSCRQHDRPVCVVRLAGLAVDKMLDDLWASQHPMLNVLQLPQL
jgi:acetoin utilization protein AcuB